MLADEGCPVAIAARTQANVDAAVERTVSAGAQRSASRRTSAAETTWCVPSTKSVGRVRAETADAGRDPAAMEFTAGGARTVDEAELYAEFGIHRLTVAIRARTIDDMRDEVAWFGDENSWRRRRSHE